VGSLDRGVADRETARRRSGGRRRLRPDEWSGARTVEFTAAYGVVEVRAHLVHDGEQLYVAFEYTANPDAVLEGAVFPEALTRDYVLPAVGAAP